MLTSGLVDLSVPTELVERGDIASTSGLGRVGIASLFEAWSFTTGEGGGEIELSNLMPSFQAGGDGT